jgi:putative oxidoreductase
MDGPVARECKTCLNPVEGKHRHDNPRSTIGALSILFRNVSLPDLFVASTPALINAALLIFRVTLGICFVVHALGKLGIVGPGNMAGFTSWLKSLGLPAPALQARIAMLSELIGGAFIACGLLTRVAALFCLIAMVVAASIGHKGGGYLITNNPPGNEYALNLAILMLVLILLGPGHYSLDHALFASR